MRAEKSEIVETAQIGTSLCQFMLLYIYSFFSSPFFLVFMCVYIPPRLLPPSLSLTELLIAKHNTEYRWHKTLCVCVVFHFISPWQRILSQVV